MSTLCENPYTFVLDFTLKVFLFFITMYTIKIDNTDTFLIVFNRIVRSIPSSLNTSSTRVDDNSVTETETSRVYDQESDQNVKEEDVTLEIRNMDLERNGTAGDSQLELNNNISEMRPNGITSPVFIEMDNSEMSNDASAA